MVCESFMLAQFVCENHFVASCEPTPKWIQIVRKSWENWPGTSRIWRLVRMLFHSARIYTIFPRNWSRSTDLVFVQINCVVVFAQPYHIPYGIHVHIHYIHHTCMLNYIMFDSSIILWNIVSNIMVCSNPSIFLNCTRHRSRSWHLSVSSFVFGEKSQVSVGCRIVASVWNGNTSGAYTFFKCMPNLQYIWCISELTVCISTSKVKGKSVLKTRTHALLSSPWRFRNVLIDAFFSQMVGGVDGWLC